MKLIVDLFSRLETKSEGPLILHGRNPEELPSKTLGKFNENEEIFASLTGPDRGLTSVNLKQKHLSISDPDVDYIDILEKNDQQTTGKLFACFIYLFVNNLKIYSKKNYTHFIHEFYLIATVLIPYFF